MDCLAWLRNILQMCGKYENIIYNNYYDSDSGLVNNSSLSLHLEKGMVRSRMLSKLRRSLIC